MFTYLFLLQYDNYTAKLTTSNYAFYVNYKILGIHHLFEQIKHYSYFNRVFLQVSITGMGDLSFAHIEEMMLIQKQHFFATRLLV